MSENDQEHADRFATEIHYEIAKELIRHGADPNYQDDLGDSALLYAGLHRSIECIELLLKSGAKVNVKDREGRTVLYYAQREGHQDVVEYLRAKGGE